MHFASEFRGDVLRAVDEKPRLVVQAAELIVDLVERACRGQEVLAVVRRVEHNGLRVGGRPNASSERHDDCSTHASRQRFTIMSVTRALTQPLSFRVS